MTASHFLSLADETPETLRRLIDRALFWKKSVRSGRVDRIFAGTKERTSPRVLGMVFQKPSTRTRVSFEMAMHHLGGKALYLSPQEVGMGEREAVKDVAAVLGRYVSAIMARVYRHKDVTELAKWSGIPVINGLSDVEHPCQALGDFLTTLENHPHRQQVTLSFIGDGNNVCHSLMIGAALLGIDFRWIGPEGYTPTKSIVEKAKSLGGKVTQSHDPKSVKGSDWVYTDVWASMGQEQEKAKRKEIFLPYRLDVELMKLAPEAKILHCLPAHRGEEITDAVIDSPNSVVIDQAENRLYAQMAVLERLLG